MSDVSVRVKINQEVLDHIDQNIGIALEAIGEQCENNAVFEITAMGAVDTGHLRGSITHTTDDDAAYVGTNVEYAGYVEFGTSKMAPRPYLENALINYANEYKQLFEDYINS